MNASTLVICRDETDPRRVRISGTKADHLVLFSHTIPLTFAQGDTGPNRAGPKGNGPSKGRGSPLAAVGAVVGPAQRAQTSKNSGRHRNLSRTPRSVAFISQLVGSPSVAVMPHHIFWNIKWLAHLWGSTRSRLGAGREMCAQTRARLKKRRCHNWHL